MKKRDFPVHDVRRYLEPGPIVLVSSKWRGRTNIMTLGWHTILEFTPVTDRLMISSGNHSHDMIRLQQGVRRQPADHRRSPTRWSDSATARAAPVDKFEKFGLTAEPAAEGRRSADQRMPRELHHQCRLHDAALVSRYNFFIFEVVKAHVAPRPKHPETLHYTGDGVFMVAGRIVSRRSLFRSWRRPEPSPGSSSSRRLSGWTALPRAGWSW